MWINLLVNFAGKGLKRSIQFMPMLFCAATCSRRVFSRLCRLKAFPLPGPMLPDEQCLHCLLNCQGRSLPVYYLLLLNHRMPLFFYPCLLVNSLHVEQRIVRSNPTSCCHRYESACSSLLLLLLLEPPRHNACYQQGNNQYYSCTTTSQIITL